MHYLGTIPFRAAGKSFFLTAVVLLAWALGAELHGATVRTWTGASLTSGNWNTAANWDNNALPVAGDTLGFPSDGARRTSNTNNFPAGRIFSAITFGGPGYRLRGNSVTLSNSVNAALNSGTNTVDLDISAGQFALVLRTFASAERLILNGDINLNARTLTTDGPGDFVIGGVISGTGGIFKDNTGDLSLSGSGANTFTGATIVNAGVLRLNRFISIGPLQVVATPGTVAIPGDLVIGSGTGGIIGDIVALERDNQIANTSDVTVNGSGSLELSDENDTIGSLALTGGTVLTGDGTLTLAGNVRVNAGTKDSLISGKLNLGAGTHRFFDIFQGAQLNVSAEISGGAGISLVKTNRGDLFLSASNTFNGPVEMVNGRLTISHGAALGTTSGSTVLRLGTLSLHDVGAFGETLEVPGPSALLTMDSISAAWNGPVILNDELSISVPTNRGFTITGRISGPAGWRKTGEGTLTFKTTFTNTYAGTGIVARGDMILDGVFHQAVISGPLVIGNATNAPGGERVSYIKQQQIGDNVPVTLNKSGLLALNGLNDTIGSLAGEGQVDLGSGGGLAIGANNLSTSFAGPISGTGGRIEKVGTGVLTLESNHTFTGETRVSRGSLIVNGSVAPSSLVIVSNVATLGGNGVVSDITLTSGGILGPGVGPGILTATGSVAFAANSAYCIDLNGATVGSLYDQLLLSGAIQLGGARLDVSLAFDPVIDDSFTIIENTSANPVQGTFAGLPQGAQFTIDGMVFFIDYEGGEGNDVVITRVPGLSFNSIMALGANQMKLQAQGLPGAKYVIQATPHLTAPIPWAPISTNTANGAGLIEFIDMDVLLYSQRFYRIAAP